MSEEEDLENEKFYLLYALEILYEIYDKELIRLEKKGIKYQESVDILYPVYNELLNLIGNYISVKFPATHIQFSEE